jgi:hypothetical protein
MRRLSPRAAKALDVLSVAMLVPGVAALIYVAVKFRAIDSR